MYIQCQVKEYKVEALIYTYSYVKIHEAILFIALPKGNLELPQTPLNDALVITCDARTSSLKNSMNIQCVVYQENVED